MIQLIVEHAGRRQAHSFDAPTVTIGRAEDCDLKISSRFVSLHHCRLERDQSGGVRLFDLDSQNGTLVNAGTVSQAKLKAGDRIEVGPVVLWFEHVPEEPTASIQDAAADEATADLREDVVITARAPAGVAGDLQEKLEEICVLYRRELGEEAGLRQLERSLLEVSGRVFPRPAFERSKEAERLAEVIRAINGANEVNKVLSMIMEGAIDLTRAERGFLVLREEAGRWRVRVARNFDHETVRGAEHKISRSLAEQVARSGRAVLSVNAQGDQRFGAFQSVADLKLRSVVCVPMRVQDQVIGTLYLDNRFQDGAFQEADLRLLESFADQAALALENTRLYESNLEARAEVERREEEVRELERALKGAERVPAEPEETPALSRESLRHEYEAIIGESPAMMELLRTLDRVIDSDLPVLVTGESGTGKELVARAIHENSPRKDGVFVRENCAAIPDTLLESELFGYAKGAFTGANTDRVGLFEQAHEGTIFLDEIGEMALDMQAKLLRVLQDGEIRPVGSRQVRRVDVRLISATNRDLKEMVAEKAFREDLFFRLNVVTLEMPPLRTRVEDIPLLIEAFAAELAPDGEPKPIDPVAMRYLLSYHWPGNVRELRNEIQRAHALSGEGITFQDLSREITEGRELPPEVPDQVGGLKEMVKLATFQKEREIILRALEEAQWQKSAAARALQISRPTLDQKIRLFGLTSYVQRGRQERRG